ncbi:MAG: HAD family hydrolase [Candidatus Eremiobacteraeota bacterium]|nr:HAD family hydrolase [Candidatus Eremiobacteraeota bacterium]
MDRIGGIGFDLDHTLAIDNRLERVAFLRLLETIWADGARTVGTLADEIDSIDELLARQRHGDFSVDDAVRRFVAERGVQPEQRHVDEFRRTAVDMVDEFLVALPGVKGTLENLRNRGIPIAILSNGWNPLQRRKAEQAGFFGPILVSSEIGEQKPEPRAFEALLQALGTDPERTWYVGDDPHCDVAGAREVGMPTVWINWERKEYPPGLAPPSHTIHDFRELLKLLPDPAPAA